SYLIFPQARLRFVDAQRGRRAERRAEMLRRQVLFVDAVAGFMQHAKERFVEVILVVTRRDAHVAGTEAGAKWMGGDVKPSGVEVEADDRSRRAPELLLDGGGEFAVQDLAVGLAWRGQDGVHQGFEVGDQAGKERAERSCRRTRLILIEQGIVGM